jgi:hypothetical protein
VRALHEWLYRTRAVVIDHAENAKSAVVASETVA